MYSCFHLLLLAAADLDERTREEIIRKAHGDLTSPSSGQDFTLGAAVACIAIVLAIAVVRLRS